MKGVGVQGAKGGHATPAAPANAAAGGSVVLPACICGPRGSAAVVAMWPADHVARHEQQYSSGLRLGARKAAAAVWRQAGTPALLLPCCRSPHLHLVMSQKVGIIPHRCLILSSILVWILILRAVHECGQ